jgi:hypothetical protein
MNSKLNGKVNYSARGVSNRKDEKRSLRLYTEFLGGMSAGK